MFRYVCEHQQARQILDPGPLEFLPQARLVVNEALRVEQLADHRHLLVAGEAAIPRDTLVRDSG